MTHNGVELKSMTFDGQEVITWVHNGVEVFGISKPFYGIENGVIQSGFPISYNTHSSSNLIWNFRNNLTDLYIGTTSSTSTANFVGYTDLIDTRNNNYLEIKVTMGSPSPNTPISLWFRDENNNNVGDTITTSGTYTVDISGVKNISIWVNVTCYAESSSSISITSLRFDNARTLYQTNYTSDTGTVIYSSELSSTYAVWKAFDGNNSTLGAAATSANPYIGYQFNDEKTIKNVIVDLAYTHGAGTNYNLSFKLQYLNNGSWVDIPNTNVTDTFVGGSSWTEKHYEWALSNITTTAIRLTEYSGSSWAMFIRTMEIRYK